MSVNIKEIAQRVLAIADSLQDPELAGVSLTGLVQDLSIIEPDTTLGQWLAVLHELVDGWSGELMGESTTASPFEVAAIVLLFAPAVPQGLLSREDANTLLRMAAEGKLEGIV